MVNAILGRMNVEGIPGDEGKYRRPAYSKEEKVQEETVGADASRDDVTQVREAIEKVLHTAKLFNRKLDIEIEQDLNVAVVKVIDSENGKVIRQIPPKELIELSKSAKDLKGLLINREG